MPNALPTPSSQRELSSLIEKANALLQTKQLPSSPKLQNFLEASSQLANPRHLYLPNLKQAMFHQASADHWLIAYLGSNNSGKTTAAAQEVKWWMHGDHPYNPKAREALPVSVIIAVPEIALGREVALLKLQEVYQRDGHFLDPVRIKDHLYKDAETGSTVKLVSLSQPIANLQGRLGDILWVDELCRERHKWQELIARVVKSRWGGKIIVSATPMTNRWFRTDVLDNEGVDSFHVVASVDDNIDNLNKEKIEAWKKGLLALGGSYYDMHALGKFGAYEGLFYSMWDQDRHIASQDEFQEFLDTAKDLQFYRSIDFTESVSTPMSCGWYAVGLLHDGPMMYRYREYYNPGDKDQQHIDTIQIMSGDEDYVTTVMESQSMPRVHDWSLRLPRDGHIDPCCPVEKEYRIIDGIIRCQGLLSRGRFKVVRDTGSSFIMEIEDYIRDPNDEQKEAKKQANHTLAEWRYLVTMIPWVAEIQLRDEEDEDDRPPWAPPLDPMEDVDMGYDWENGGLM